MIDGISYVFSLKYDHNWVKINFLFLYNSGFCLFFRFRIVNFPSFRWLLFAFQSHYGTRRPRIFLKYSPKSTERRRQGCRAFLLSLEQWNDYFLHIFNIINWGSRRTRMSFRKTILLFWAIVRIETHGVYQFEPTATNKLVDRFFI